MAYFVPLAAEPGVSSWTADAKVRKAAVVGWSDGAILSPRGWRSFLTLLHFLARANGVGQAIAFRGLFLRLGTIGDDKKTIVCATSQLALIVALESGIRERP